MNHIYSEEVFVFVATMGGKSHRLVALRGHGVLADMRRLVPSLIYRSTQKFFFARPGGPADKDKFSLRKKVAAPPHG